MNTKIELTPRTIIKCYWTTDPDFMGYGRNLTWEPLRRKADVKGTPNTILENWQKEKQKVGLNSGIYFAVRFYVKDKQIDIDDIRDFNAFRKYV